MKGVTKFGIVIEPGVDYGSVHGSTGIAIDVVDRINDLKLAIPYQRIGKDGKIYYDCMETPKRTKFYKINNTFILYNHPQFNTELNKIDTKLPCKK